jgi:hypothetical protein
MQVLQDRRVDRWLAAGVIDETTADRIRAFERDRASGTGRRGPVLLALGFGGILVAAGVLLFVSANWDQMSPSARMAVVLATVGLFHVAGAFAAGRFEALATTLHAIGTAALGAGIFLAGQIFNLNEHWASGVLFWAIGAWIGWALRRDWAQLALALILTPAWLNAEWSDYAGGTGLPIPGVGWTLLALAYLTLERERLDRATERTVSWLGALVFLPAGISLTAESMWRFGHGGWSVSPWNALPAGAGIAVAWVVAVGGSLAAAAVFRRTGAWLNLVAAGWTLVLANLYTVFTDRFWIYPWLGVGCIGLAGWGLREARAALVNFATVGFALTVLGFYFDTVMPKVDRSVSLMGLGLLFLGGGYLLERVRRRVVGQFSGGGI